jgi:peptide/nickel transport system ATP-binding protein/oligopeptide transport system ATP-binding protein
MESEVAPLLSVHKLKKYFAIRSGLWRKTVGYVQAVNDVSFDLYPGEILGIVGESGCGKSTLARAAIRLLEPTSGSVKYQGQDFLALNRKELLSLRPEIQIVFQDPFGSLNPRKRIVDAIGEGILYHGFAASREQARELSVAALEEVGLSRAALDKYPHQFSGGQQQRICIARAISLYPKLLVCDEAVSALDVSVQAQIINLLLQLKEKKGLSYLFISHDLSIVRYLCTRVVVLYLGKVMEVATTDELFSNPRHPYTRALLASIPKRHPKDAAPRQMLSGELPSPANPPSGCPFRTRCPYAQPICAEPPPKKDPSKTHSYWCILDSV